MLLFFCFDVEINLKNEEKKLLRRRLALPYIHFIQLIIVRIKC